MSFFGVVPWILGAMIIAPVPCSATVVFGLVDTGELYASADNGSTWSIHATLAVRDAVALAAGTSTLDLYMATRSGSIYRSSNGGASWTAVGAVTASDVVAMEILPSGTILVLAESGAVYASTDQGVSFTGLAGLTNREWVAFARGPAGRLYALSRKGQVAQSQDNGATWTTIASIPISNAVSIRRRNAELFVMSETGELYRSLDYGVTWVAVFALTSSSMNALAAIGPTLLATTREGEVASTSSGTSWAWVGAINQLQVVSLGVDTPLATGVEVEQVSPRAALRAPWPNPSRSGSVFSFSLSVAGPARLEAYDAQGRLHESLDIGFLAPGPASRRWAPRLGSGVYFVRLATASGESQAVKWTILE